MMSSGLRCLFLLSTAIALLAGGCSRHGHTDAHDAGGDHHTAPHGGVLVELGDHVANLEVVHEVESGRLSVFVLDAHAENFVRISAPSIAVVVHSGSESRPLLLSAVANAATGETVGDTSQFSAQAPFLIGSGPYELEIPGVEIPAGRFSDIRVTFPSHAHESDHGHEAGAH